MTKSMTPLDNAKGEINIRLRNALRFLSAAQVTLIDEMLDKVSPFGEVALKVTGGKLKFAAQSKSYDAFKLQRRSTKDKIRGNER